MSLNAADPPFITQQDCDGSLGEDIFVWRCWLGEGVDEGSLARLLSRDELDRAARFVFERDRRRFVAARAALRTILGRALGEAPEHVAFVYGPQGKPAIDPAWRVAGLQFNLAHSGDWALVAMANGRRIGVDIEQIRPVLERQEIARRHFSADELSQLAALSDELQQEAFFRCWTRKEAYLKALGCGLSLPLDSFDVSVAPQAAPALLADRGDAQAPTRWRMAELRPAAGYLGALAIEADLGVENAAVRS